MQPAMHGNTVPATIKNQIHAFHRIYYNECIASKCYKVIFNLCIQIEKPATYPNIATDAAAFLVKNS